MLNVLFFSFDSRFAVGARPIDLWLRAYPFRLFMGVVFAAVVWITPNFGTDGEFSIYFYITIVLIFMVQQVRKYVRRYMCNMLIRVSLCTYMILCKYVLTTILIIVTFDTE